MTGYDGDGRTWRSVAAGMLGEVDMEVSMRRGADEGGTVARPAALLLGPPLSLPEGIAARGSAGAARRFRLVVVLVRLTSPLAVMWQDGRYGGARG